jgi:uncharacterized phage protein (TIGR01671 family)
LKNRIYRFRAWDKKNKKFICDYTKILPYHYKGEEHDLKIGGGRNHMGIYVLNDNEDDCELLMYTGLKDKNGKEIYEGDIVKELYCSGYTFYIVKFGFYDNDEGWEDSVTGYGYYLEQIYDYYRPDNQHDKEKKIFDVLYPDITKCEIVGNIYENPELLKKVK